MVKIESLLKTSFVHYNFFLDCHGGNTCCTPQNKCGMDEGDCDSNDDCEKGLKCGRDNCPYKTGNEWNKEDDCCYKPVDGKSFNLLRWFSIVLIFGEVLYIIKESYFALFLFQVLLNQNLERKEMLQVSLEYQFST